MQKTQETRVRSLGQEDSLEEKVASHSSILAWKIPRTEEPDRQATIHGVTKSWTQLSDSAHEHAYIYNLIFQLLQALFMAVRRAKFSHSVITIPKQK